MSTVLCVIGGPAANEVASFVNHAQIEAAVIAMKLVVDAGGDVVELLVPTVKEPRNVMVDRHYEMAKSITRG